MLNGFKYSVMLVAVGLFVCAPASALLIYDNGADPGNIIGWTINNGFVVSDNFKVPAAPPSIHLGSVVFSNWLTPGDVPLTLGYTISSGALGGGIVFESGIVPLTVVSTTFNPNGSGFLVEEVSLSLQGSVYAAGTYWLTLGQVGLTVDGTTGEKTKLGGTGYWGQDNTLNATPVSIPPSDAFQNTLGELIGNCNAGNPPTCGSESFQVFDTGGAPIGPPPPPGSPEPASMTLFGSGLLLLAGVLRRKARK